MTLVILSFTINKRRKASEIASPALTEDWTSYGTLIQSPLLPSDGEMVFYFSIMGGCGAVEEAGCWGAASQLHHNLLATPAAGVPSSLQYITVSVCLWPPLGVCVSFCISVSVSGRVCLFMSACLGVLSVTGSWGRCW